VKFVGIVLVLGAFLCGCAKSDVSEADQKALEAKYSQEAYEEAMRKNGRGAELEEEKRLAREREEAR
jgi:hypothetical protein